MPCDVGRVDTEIVEFSVAPGGHRCPFGLAHLTQRSKFLRGGRARLPFRPPDPSQSLPTTKNTRALLGPELDAGGWKEPFRGTYPGVATGVDLRVSAGGDVAENFWHVFEHVQFVHVHLGKQKGRYCYY